LEGEKVWNHVGTLSLKDKGQLEERLRRIPTGKTPGSPNPYGAAPHGAASRLSMGSQRPESPAFTSRLARPMSPALSANGRDSPSGRPASSASLPGVAGNRAKTHLPSRLGAPKGRLSGGPPTPTSSRPVSIPAPQQAAAPPPARPATNGHVPQQDPNAPDDISLIISNILSHDASRSVEALKKIQKILELSPEAGKNDARYRELADHTEGLIETITLQMSHVFDQDIQDPANFRLAKHLIQTLNAFCDHPILSESLSVDSLRGLLEELTLRLLITDESSESKVKDLSKFINMIILRLFATGRRITIFR